MCIHTHYKYTSTWCLPLQAGTAIHLQIVSRWPSYHCCQSWKNSTEAILFLFFYFYLFLNFFKLFFFKLLKKHLLWFLFTWLDLCTLGIGVGNTSISSLTGMMITF